MTCPGTFRTAGGCRSGPAERVWVSKLTASRRPGVPHHRARHTPLGRWMVVRRVVQEGDTFAQAAAWTNVSKSTVWEWVRRWRHAGPDERESLSCLTEHSSRPHHSPAQV